MAAAQTANKEEPKGPVDRKSKPPPKLTVVPTAPAEFVKFFSDEAKTEKTPVPFLSQELLAAAKAKQAAEAEKKKAEEKAQEAADDLYVENLARKFERAEPAVEARAR